MTTSYDRANLVQGQYNSSNPTLVTGSNWPIPLDVNGNLKVAVVTSTASDLTPVGGTASAIVTSNVAVTLVTGPVNGGYIVNPYNAASQGIAIVENAYVDPVGTPGSTDSAGNGTTAILFPGQIYTVPPLTSGAVIKANAATTGHKFTVVVY